MPTEAKLQNKGKKSFFKTDFAKMGGTALVTSLIFLAVIFSSEIADIFNPPSQFMSESISLKVVRDLRDKYLTDNNIKPLQTLYNGKIVPLQGFIFSRESLRNILSWTHENPDGVIFYLGRGPDVSSDNNIVVPNYSLIAIGIKDGQLTLPSSDSIINKYKVQDKADPCPGPGCRLKNPLSPSEP